MEHRLVAFDLDDTLAVTKSPIEEEMAALLGDLLAVVDVLVISGGAFPQFQTQVVDRLHLDDARLRRLHLMPTCGTRYHTYGGNGSWPLQYAEDLHADQKQHVVDTLAEGAKALGLWEEHPYGDIIEDRGSQITLSALGQEAPPDVKHAWDPTGAKREALRAYCAPRLPDLEVRSGGSTSIDVTRRGIDKAYGMTRLLERLHLTTDDVLFIGDRLDEGGNDYPVKAMGIATIAVTGWRHTAEVVRSLLAAPGEAAPREQAPGEQAPGGKAGAGEARAG
jgi:phosphomannomutase